MGVATMVVIKETIPHLHGGTHQPQILRDTVDHQHQIRRIPGIVAHQIIAEMPRGSSSERYLIKIHKILGFNPNF